MPRFAGQLPQPMKVVNPGISGLALPETVQRMLPRAVEAQPDLVTVWLVGWW